MEPPSLPRCLLQCLLSHVHFRYDLSLGLDDEATPWAVDVVPHLPARFSGCSGGGIAPATAFNLFSRVVVVPQEDAAAVPALLPGRGFPAPGQAEVSDRDVLLASGDQLAPEERARLEADVASGRGDAGSREAAPKSFFQQYWHLIVPAMLVYMLMSGGGGAGGGREGEGGADGAPPAAAGRRAE